jgi:hypothetical protein
MLNENSNDKSFILLISSLKLLRNIYDRLSKEELLFLVYVTFPEYTEFSKISDNLLNNSSNRRRILSNLLRKGAITQKRYEELKDGRQEACCR